MTEVVPELGEVFCFSSMCVSKTVVPRYTPDHTGSSSLPMSRKAHRTEEPCKSNDTHHHHDRKEQRQCLVLHILSYHAGSSPVTFQCPFGQTAHRMPAPAISFLHPSQGTSVMYIVASWHRL